MILGSSDFTGSFILVDGVTGPLVSIGTGADYAAISLDKAASETDKLSRSVLTLSNALPVATGNLALFAGAAAFAKREVKSLNAELAKTIGLMSGLSAVSTAGAPILGGGGGVARIETGRPRGRPPNWKRDVLPGNLLPRGPGTYYTGSHNIIGTPRFTRAGAIGYTREPKEIGYLSTAKIGALLYTPESKTQQDIARKMAAGASLAEADRIIRRGYIDEWIGKHRKNLYLSKPFKQYLTASPISKKNLLKNPNTPFYVKDVIENAAFREMGGNENVPDAGGAFKDVQKYFNSVGAGEFTTPDENILRRRYARNGAIMRRISSVVDEYMGKKGAYTSYNPYLNQRMFKAFTEGEEGMKLSKMESKILDTLREDRKQLSRFTGPKSGISWRIGEDRGFRTNDLAIMSRIQPKELAKQSEMLSRGELDNWVLQEYSKRSLKGLEKRAGSKLAWHTGEREKIYPIKNWQRNLIRSLSKPQLVDLTNIKRGTWTEDALSKESMRRLRAGIPLHFDTLFDKHPELLPKTNLLPGRVAPFVSEKGMDASIRRTLRSIPYKTTLRDIATKQALPKTVEQWRTGIMKKSVDSLISDFNTYGSYPSGLEITKRHDRAFLREKIRKKLVRTQFWDVLRSPVLSESFTGRAIEKEAPIRANQKRYLEWFTKQRAWEKHLGILRRGRGVPTDYYLNQWIRKQAELEPLKAWKEYNNKLIQLRESFHILPAPVSKFKQFESAIKSTGEQYTPRSIRIGLFSNTLERLGFSSRSAVKGSEEIEKEFGKVGNKAVSAEKATKVFTNALRKMGASATTVSMGTYIFEKELGRLSPPLQDSAFRTSLLSRVLRTLTGDFKNTGGNARKFGFLSAIAFNAPLLSMGLMLGMMPPLIGGFAALASAAIGLIGAFALLGLGGAMAWGEKLSKNKNRLASLNKELGVTGKTASKSIGKASYTVGGLTTGIGGLALVLNEFKRKISPIFYEFGKPWIPFMEKLPGAIAGGLKKIFTEIAPFSDIVQHDAMAVGGWFVNILSGFMKYSLGLLRNPEIRSAFKTIMDVIPKYGKKGMDFIVKAFLENKGTIKDFLKSMIELLPPFLTAMTAFFRTITPVITIAIKKFKSLVKILGGGDINRGANFFGLVLGGLAFAGALSKAIRFAATLITKFIDLKKIITTIKIAEIGGGILGGVGRGGKGIPGGSGPVIIPPGAKIPKGKIPGGGKLSSVIAGAGTIATRLAPLALLAYMGYVTVDAMQMKEESRKAYQTDPRYRAAVDSATLTEQQATARAHLQALSGPPDISNLTGAHNTQNKNKQAVQDLQGSAQNANIRVDINADPEFVVRIKQAMSKDANLDSWVHYRTG